MTKHAEFIPLGDLPGGDFVSIPQGVSADGAVVVGYSGRVDPNRKLRTFEAFAWQDGRMFGLGHLPGGGLPSEATAIALGTGEVLGVSPVRPGPNSCRGMFKWTAANGLQVLEKLKPADKWRYPAGISNDGKIIVGSLEQKDPIEAMFWNDKGINKIGFLPGGDYSRASGISGDGAIIVGSSRSAQRSQEAFKWTERDGMVGLGVLSTSKWASSKANAIANDGAVVVGFSEKHAFFWSRRSGLVDLGIQAGFAWSSADGVSDGGKIIIGRSAGGERDGAFVWTKRHGMRSLRTELIDNYALGGLLFSWVFDRATAITPSGNAIVGVGVNPAGQTEGFLIRFYDKID